jgi:hypothetical protein
MAFSP